MNKASAEKRWFLEVPGGDANLSRRLRRKGWCVIEPVECYPRDGGHRRPSHDLRLPAVRREVWRKLVASKGVCVHFAVDCRSWSVLGVMNGSGRSRAKPWGNAEVKWVAETNLVTAFLVRCVVLLHRRGDRWSVENQESSFLWCLPKLKKLAMSTQTVRVKVDQCEYGLTHEGAAEGEFFKKPTSILTNCPELAGLESHCQGSHVHIDIRGPRVTLGGRLVR